MKLLPRLVIVLVVCLIAMALPAAPAQAVCVPYDMELSPSWGIPGTEVTVYGHDFAAGKFVDIYYDGIRIAEGIITDRAGEFTYTFTIPEGCTGQYKVQADVGYTEVHHYFTVKPGLIVVPEKGPVGTTVTVTGQGFARNEDDIELRYYLTSDSYEMVQRRITANAKGSWQASFQIPLSNIGEHKLDAQGAVSRLWEVQEAIFRVTAEISIDKSSGSVGDAITMTGSRFTAYEKGIKILFDGEAVVTGIEANSKGEWEASFEVTEMPAGEYNVTAEGEQTRKEDMGELSFEINPEILLSPTGGHVDTEVTILGNGFAADKDVVILYDDSQVATAETDDKGNFDASFLVPESQHGERMVAARVTGGTNSTADLETNASAVFTMESDPPHVPALLSPSNKSRLGFMGEVTPTFEWSEVFDDSGVRYNLQVATSADFTATGEFVDPMVSVTNLEETSYTLDETEALPLGSYYWIVQAVDGAENESDWSSVHSFRVGLLPLWGLIAAIAAAVVLLVLLIRALIIRRTIYYDRW